MRKYVTWFAMVVLAALLETTLWEKLRLFGVLPDMMVLLVVFFALREGEEWAMFTAVLGGLFQDVAGDTLVGHHILGLAIVGYVVGKVSTRLVTEHPVVKVGLVFLSGLCAGLFFLGIEYVLKPTVPIVSLLLAEVIPAAFYTSLLTPVVFWIVERVVGKFWTTPVIVTE